MLPLPPATPGRADPHDPYEGIGRRTKTERGTGDWGHKTTRRGSQGAAASGGVNLPHGEPGDDYGSGRRR
jgi:hypothetical protein